MNSDPLRPVSQPLNPTTTDTTQTHSVSTWTAPFTEQEGHRDRVAVSGLEERSKDLREPLLLVPPPTVTAETSAEIQDSFHSIENFGEQSSLGYHPYSGTGGVRGRGGDGSSEMTVVELHTHRDQ